MQGFRTRLRCPERIHKSGFSGHFTYWWHVGSSAVPVSNWIVEAFADGDSLVTQLGQGGQHIFGKIVGGLLVDIVGDAQPVTVGRCGTPSGDVAPEPILRILDLGRRVLVIVIRVNIEIRDAAFVSEVDTTVCWAVSLIAEVCHGLFTSRGGIATRVGWAHVGREEAENISQGHFVLDHLVGSVRCRDLAQIQMGPCVRAYLVAFAVHALDDCSELRSGINLALGQVGSGDEECPFGIIGFE